MYLIKKPKKSFIGAVLKGAAIALNKKDAPKNLVIYAGPGGKGSLKKSMSTVEI